VKAYSNVATGYKDALVEIVENSPSGQVPEVPSTEVEVEDTGSQTVSSTEMDEASQLDVSVLDESLSVENQEAVEYLEGDEVSEEAEQQDGAEQSVEVNFQSNDECSERLGSIALQELNQSVSSLVIHPASE
jgi:hypothetical protein